jgi:hypothetical protein
MNCTKCGAVIPAGSSFCPRCGTPVVAPVAPVTPVVAAPPPRRSHMAIWVAIAVAALGLLAWAVLSGLPFGGREPQMHRVETPAPSTIGEGSGASTTMSQIGEPAPMTTTTAPAPPMTRTTAVAPQPMPAPQPVTPRPLPAPQPAIATPQPPVVRDEPTPQPAAEISDAEATQILSRHLAATNTYDVASSCLGIRNLGYKNVGYTLEVVDRCAGGTLGRWRVDSKTRELFRQQGDGRYLRP